jgi:hypothetical protein
MWRKGCHYCDISRHCLVVDTDNGIRCIWAAYSKNLVLAVRVFLKPHSSNKLQ